MLEFNVVDYYGNFVGKMAARKNTIVAVLKQDGDKEPSYLIIQGVSEPFCVEGTYEEVVAKVFQ